MMSSEYNVSMIFDGVYNDDIVLIENIINNDRSFLFLKNKRNASLLHVACAQNSIRVVNFLLSLDEILDIINLANNWGETPLHIAASVGNVDFTISLVSKGASTSVLDNWERTALDVARQNGYSSVVAYLTPLTVQNDKKIEGKEVESIRMSGILRDIQKNISAEFLKKLSTMQDIRVPDETIVKHIFKELPSPSTQQSSNIILNNTRNHNAISNNDNNENNNSTRQTLETRKPLSKFIEYPGDPIQIASMLTNPSFYDPAGKDMFGWSAIHKFASWDKVDLLKLLLLKLKEEEINAFGGPKQYSCLHCCVDMRSINALTFLLTDNRIDTAIVNKDGVTAKNMAEILNYHELIKLFNDISQAV